MARYFLILLSCFFATAPAMAAPCKTGVELYKDLYTYRYQAKMLKNARKTLEDRERATAVLIWKQDGYSTLYLPDSTIATIGECYRDGNCNLERSFGASLGAAITESSLINSPKISADDLIPEHAPLISVIWAEKILGCGNNPPNYEPTLAKSYPMIKERAQTQYALAQARDGAGQNIEAYKNYKGACEGTIAAACHQQGLMQFNALGTPQDSQGAFKSFLRACSVRYLASCDSGGMIAQEIMSEMEADGSMVLEAGIYRGRAHWAATLFLTACHFGYHQSCGRYGDVIETHFPKAMSEGKKAVKYTQIGCDNNDRLSCYVLSSLYREGHFVTKDIQKSAQAMMKANSLQ